MPFLLLFYVTITIHGISVVFANDCNYAQYKWVQGDGYADIYPFDVCMTSTVCCPQQPGSFIHSCINGTGYNTGYTTRDCTGTPLFHSPLNTGQWDVYCNYSVNCPYVQYASYNGDDMSSRVTGVCYGYATSSNPERNYSQHICWNDKAFTAWYGNNNPDCIGTYEIEEIANSYYILQCTDPFILPTKAPIVTPTTATPTKAPTKQLLTTSCNYVQDRNTNGGASNVYPIDVCLTTSVCCPTHYESRMWTCDNGTAYLTNWDSSDCSGQSTIHYPIHVNPIQGYSGYYGTQCNAPSPCSYAVYEWTSQLYGPGTSAVVTGLCYDSRGWNDSMSHREWSQNTCNNGRLYQVDYGATNGDCTGNYYINEYIQTEYSVTTCTDPIYLPTPIPTNSPSYDPTSDPTMDPTFTIINIAHNTCIYDLASVPSSPLYFSCDFSGSVLTVTGKSGTGIVGLFVLKSTIPETDSFDCYKYIDDGGYESCTMNQDSGIYYIRLEGWSEYEDMTLCAWNGTAPTSNPSPEPTPQPLSIPVIGCGEIIINVYWAYNITSCFGEGLQPICIGTQLYWNYYNTANCSDQSDISQTVSNQEFEHKDGITDYECCADLGHPKNPALSPTDPPNKSPTTSPLPFGDTKSPTTSPSAFPSAGPTSSTIYPTVSPTNATFMPTRIPTVEPTIPTDVPSLSPTMEPTLKPTDNPTVEPISLPTINATKSTETESMETNSTKDIFEDNPTKTTRNQVDETPTPSCIYCNRYVFIMVVIWITMFIY